MLYRIRGEEVDRSLYLFTYISRPKLSKN